MSSKENIDSSLVIAKALKNFAEFKQPSAPLRHLPLLDELNQYHLGEQSFADIDVLFIQHHVGPFIAHLQAMVDKGMALERAWFVDIPYSSNDEVKELLVEFGFPVNQQALAFNDPLACYNSSQKNRLAVLLEVMERRKDPRSLLVVDDGAYFVRYLYHLAKISPQSASKYIGTKVVEQTTRGHRYLYSTEGLGIIKSYKLSVVSIARAKTKKQFEGPFIGAVVSRAMKRAIGRQRFIDAANIAVIGCGVVGEATIKEILRISPDSIIDIVDTDAQARQRGKQFAPKCSGLSELRVDKQYDVVLGCTGYGSFSLDQRKLLSDGAVLASGSSAAVEFNRTKFIELADRNADDEIEVINRGETISAGIHAEIRIKHESGKMFSFLNGGFPVNFDGRMECLPTQIVQATHALLLAACKQVQLQQYAGMSHLNHDDDQWIFTKATRLLATAPELKW